MHKLKRPVQHFAYPDGRFNAAVVSVVAEAGYRYGFGTCLRRDARYPSLTIPRTLLWERSCVDAGGRFSAGLMSCHAHRVYDLWSSCSHNHEEEDATSAFKTNLSTVENEPQPSADPIRSSLDTLHV